MAKRGEVTILSPDEAEAAGLMQLTVADNAAHQVVVNYGTITHKEWCVSEAIRIGMDARRKAAVVAHGDGRYSTWVNPIVADVAV